jgi:hypothetical protein
VNEINSSAALSSSDRLWQADNWVGSIGWGIDIDPRVVAKVAVAARAAAATRSAEMSANDRAVSAKEIL